MSTGIDPESVDPEEILGDVQDFVADRPLIPATLGQILSLIEMVPGVVGPLRFILNYKYDAS